MTTEESEVRDTAETSETHIEIPQYAWPITGVFAILVVGVIIYLCMGEYNHITKGQLLGVGNCKECHKEQHASWKKTRMANSFNVLYPGQKAKEKQLVGLDPEKDYTHDESCLPCHTTGYGLVGGFVSIELTPEMAGIGCEACHGHGGSYVRTVMNPKNPSFRTSIAREAGLIYPPPEHVCRECHNERSHFVKGYYKFYYDERVKLGTHEHYHLKYEHGM